MPREAIRKENDVNIAFIVDGVAANAEAGATFERKECHFWHFRFDANTDIKMAALTNYLKAQPAIKKVYFINQDYSFGRSFRAQARTMLTEKRPDIEIRMLAKAISDTKSEDVRKVAEKLEDMRFPGVGGGEVWVRKEDHQAFQPIYVGRFGPLKAGEKFDEEGTGWGWRQVGAVGSKDTVLPTACKMERAQ